MELMKEVADYILASEPEVKERIGGIMGGKVLELETDRILERGMKQGRLEDARKMLVRGFTCDDVADILELDRNVVETLRRELR